jgi:eukaryotic-like serine/threonine-protein kinase
MLATLPVVVTPNEAAPKRARPDLPGELGRFVVLHRVGTGGMGVVFAAYDPELDRKVAVKLLHPNLKGSERRDVGRARLQREAQAMAKLSHPNVVTVFDVGAHGDQVFIAMEFVQGAPLPEWLQRPRDWQAVVAVFLGAGRGLAAAHRRGIVHGDFKPDNVIVDPEGRARVLDFGLAFAQDRGEGPTVPLEQLKRSSMSDIDLGSRLTRTGALTGTPPYISPEQYLGDPASARTDQYAFCVSLYEALYGERPFRGEDLQRLRQQILLANVPDEPRERRIPGWLRRVVLRGMHRDPAQRFTDMPALLAELARDRGRRRLRIGLAIAGVLALAAAALAYRWWLINAYADQLAARQGMCAGAAEQLAGVWDGERRARVGEAMLATRVAYAEDTRERVASRLDDYASAWMSMHTDACLANVRGEQSSALLDRRMACLHRARTELRTLVDVLAGADVKVVEHAAEAVAQLPPLTRCADADALLAERPPPTAEEAAAQDGVRAQIARTRALARTTQLKAGLALIAPALTEAGRLADRAPLAEALLAHGELLHLSGEHAAAERVQTDAFFTAESARSDRLTALAAIDLVRGSLQQSNAGAVLWARHARAQIDRVAERSVHDARRLEVDLLHGVGTVQVHEGDHEHAEQSFARALELLASLPDPDLLRRASLHNNLGNLHVRRGDLASAEDQLGEASEIYRAELGPRHPNVAIALNNLGEVQMRRGQLVAALGSYTQAHAILVAGLGPSHPNVGVALNNLGDVLQRQGLHAPAEEHYLRALAIFEARFGEAAPPLAYPLTGLGEALLAQGRRDEALTRLERALALRDAGSKADLARTRMALARALWRDPAARTRARELAGLARDELRGAGPVAARELGEAEAWLADPR